MNGQPLNQAPAAPAPAAGSYAEAFQNWLGSQSGYIGKSKKAEFKQNYIQDGKNDKRLDDLVNGQGPGQFSLGGSANESRGRLEGLERAKILTGQNPYEIGADYQQAYGNLRKRSEGTDTGSELLRANKAGAVADARNQLQSQGVKGGAAAGAVSQIERAKSYDVNNQLVQAQRQAQNDFMNATKANANFTTANEMNFGAMAMGKDVQAPPQNSSGFAGMGTVICTELYRQGYMDRKTFLLDVKYGIEINIKRPDIYRGYRYMADPIVSLMKKSPLFTKVIAVTLSPWAKHMAGEKNIIGAMTEVIGKFVCGLVGKYILGVEKYAAQKA